MRLTGFEGKLAIVTGAAGGIGQAVTRALLDAGATVIATDTEAALAATPVAGGAIPHVLDVRDGPAADALVAWAEGLHGPLALGIHVAGIVTIAPLLDMTLDDWQHVFDINTTGTFNVTRAFGVAMARHGAGAIVTVSSNAAGIPRLNMGAYAASRLRRPC